MKFSKYNNPSKKRKAKKDTATAWGGSLSRENYISSIISCGLNVDGTKPQKKQ